APAFSPDGSTVAFSQGEPDGSWHIWTVPAAGGTPRQLTSGRVPETYSRFAPDGALVLYHTWSSGPDRVWRVPAGGGAPAPITPARQEDDAYPDPSPDGRSLAFARTEGDQTRVYVSAADGSGARLLVNAASTLPRWSKDGRWIAFASSRSINSGIFVVAADGSGPRRLTDTGSWPAWWPDGLRIGYIAAGPDGNQQIHTVPFQGGPGRAIVGPRFNGANYPFDIAPDGKSIVTTNTYLLAAEIWRLDPK
ncbi:MAG: PD40 domain-containing protein, partial [Acidobacteria bacterium]|nr:PD40 domain-containing protein [Acidobacteriota bacterium]